MRIPKIFSLFLSFLLVASPLFFVPLIDVDAAIVSQSWEETNFADAPVGRRGHVTVWTGSEMLIWGGEITSGGCSVNDGKRYDPVSDTWSPISSINAPSPRRAARAVWTGTEMIVWGGENCNSGPTLNTGARYNPATDTWTPMTNVNAPEERYVFAAVWTGTEMLVWGGDKVSPGVISLNTGGRYDPSTDTWTAMSTVGAPSARSHPSSAWTGTEMIIWGGSDDCCTTGGEVPSGARYNPATDTWSSMDPGDANAGFKFNTSAWTGSEFIVWGGYKVGDVFVNTGQKYDPDTDTWSPMSTVDAPTARGYVSSVWTDGYYMVWGGYDGSSLVNTGAIYDPATDTWTATTTVDVPTARDANSLVWTGDNVIVWGGFDYLGQLKNTGAIFSFEDDVVQGVPVSDFVVLGEEGVYIKSTNDVLSGDVGANIESAGPFLNSGAEVTIGGGVDILDADSAVYGDTVVLKSNSRVNDIFYNELSGPGSVLGDTTNPFEFPIVEEFPDVPSFTEGSVDVSVTNYTTQHVSPGSYKDLVVGDSSTVIFDGGVYDFRSWDIDEHSNIYFDASSEVRISGRIKTDEEVVIAPNSGSGINASDIKIIVTGTNGSVGAIGSNPKAVKLASRNTVAANIYAPNGSIVIVDRLDFSGSLIGKWVVVGSYSTLHLDSAF